MSVNKPLILVRGGGDLASGVILRLKRVHLNVIVSELPQPLAVRRSVSFAEAVYKGRHTVEGLTARLVEQDRIAAALEAGEIPVIVDPHVEVLSRLPFHIVVDARLLKRPPAPLPMEVPLHIGLGPGFHAGQNCHAVIETRRSHTLGRVYWNGTVQADSGQPEGDPRRVLRAPDDGVLAGRAKIGDHVEEGDVVAVIQPVILADRHIYSTQVPEGISEKTGETIRSARSDLEVVSPLSGVLRGIIHDGVRVTSGLKIGDVDPRDDPDACFLVSDKALAIGGGVLEAILSRREIREGLIE
jgi:xanthine dehydrogenase accessory factor